MQEIELIIKESICNLLQECFVILTDVQCTGGATYCALASLLLMGFLEDDLISKSASSSCIIDVPLLLDWSLKVKFYLLRKKCYYLCKLVLLIQH